MNLIEQIKVNDISIDGYQGTYYSLSPEYIQVTTDSEGKILESIKPDGSKHITGNLIVDGSIYNNSLNGIGETLSFFEQIDNNEWLQVTLDSDGKVITGIDANGRLYSLTIDELENKIAEVEAEIPSDESLERIIEPIVDEKIEEYGNKRLICCDGDSLTYSQDGQGLAVHAWPKILQDSLGDGYKVFNFGIPGAPSTTLVANPTCYKVTSDFNIPASGTSTFFTLEPLKNMTDVYSWTMGPVSSFGTMGGTNPCWINGIKGNLVYARNAELVYGAKFTRFDSGEIIEVLEGDLILTNEYVNCKNADHMIFIGCNGGWRLLDSQGNQRDIQDVDCVNELIAQQDMIIRESGELYIVLSYCGWYTDNGNTTPVTPWIGESMFMQKYKEHYINLREYFSTTSIQDALDRGYLVNDDPEHPTYPTAIDTQRMAVGKPAASIRAADGVHFNDVGYHLIGDLVAKTYKNLIKKKILGTLN